MKREIHFEPGFDKRNPDPIKNYGVGAMEVRFLLFGEKGVVQFLIGTGWLLPTTDREYESRGIPRSAPTGWDIGYHSPIPMYEGQEPISDKCEYLDGGKCYYDGSSSAADRLLEKFLVDGEAVIWGELEEYYKERFGGDA